jgi:hypothetical protein
MPMLSEKEVRQLLEDAKYQYNEEKNDKARVRLAGMMIAYRKVLKE